MTNGSSVTEDKNGAVSPDYIIRSLGGCGRFQVRMAIVVHLIKTIVCFTFIGMIVISSTPSWWCQDDVIDNGLKSCMVYENETRVNKCQTKSCYNSNKTACRTFGYDGGINTIVNEFNLVCKQDYIPSIINSIQIAGTLVGNVAAGQTADLFGRKPPFFFSIFLLMTFNIIGYFTSSWEMMAVVRFFAGMGGGFFLTTQYCLMSEFSPAKWRVWLIGFPSWPIQASLFSLLGWLLHDWRYIQLMTGLMAVPCFLAWWVIPESFRWYIAHDRPEQAEGIVRSVAKFNRHTDFDIDTALQKPDTKADQKYTILHLFRTKKMAKVTFLLSLAWIALGLVGYGIVFGIPTLSGNIFFNLFLFNMTGIPSKAVALWLQNRIGRRYTAILCFADVAVSGTLLGVVQLLDTPHKNILTTAFALIAYMGISSAWGPVQTMTVELYPTVIRNIGFGTLSVTGRIGAIVGPQLVYMNKYVPGILYFVCGGTSLICVIALIFLPETMDKNLNDKIKKGLDFEASVEKTDTKDESVDKEKGTESSPKKNDKNNLLPLDVNGLLKNENLKTDRDRELAQSNTTHL